MQQHAEPTTESVMDFDDLIAEPIDPANIEHISAEEDPELANLASERALRGDRPLMPDAPVGQVTLPGGWIDREGNRHTVATVRELTGRDEEKLSRIDPQANYPLYIQTMVKAGVETIGNREPTDEMLRDLLVGDREALLLGIRVATYGNELELHVICPHCQAEEDLAVELDKDVPIKEMETPEIRQYDVELRAGKVAVVEPATAGIQDIVWDIKKSVAEMKTATLEKCVRTIDGRPVTHKDVLDLGWADRKTLINFLADLQPGPDYEGIELPCQACSVEFTLLFSLGDLFR